MKSLIILVILATIYSDHYSVWSGATTGRGKEFEARWNKYKSLTDAQKDDVKSVEKVCGKVLGEVKCSQMVGRSVEAEDNNCDHYCCSQGFLIGFCKKDAIIDPSLINKKISISIKPVANCLCTNDWKDANCGPDGRFLGISCPVDSSACNRNCCREGSSGGKCGGFLKTKCKCD